MVQSVNLPAIFYTPFVRFFDKSLAIPHFSIPDINHINPRVLKDLGIEGLVFDKDNTITAPYENFLFSTIETKFREFQEVFGDRVVIVSNSAGTRDDKDFRDAQLIEDVLGIKVLRHIWKKPAGILPVKEYFGCEPTKLAMFGDRIFTDVVFGNRYGMLTFHTTMLTDVNDNKAAAKIRKYEMPLIEKWKSEGIEAPFHSMNSDRILDK